MRCPFLNTFAVGNVYTSSYREVVGHETVRAVVISAYTDDRTISAARSAGALSTVTATSPSRDR